MKRLAWAKTALWRTALDSPVAPELKKQRAGLPERTRTGVNESDAARIAWFKLVHPLRSLPASKNVLSVGQSRRRSATISAEADAAMIAAASVRLARATTSRSRSEGLEGTAIAPSLRIATKAACHLVVPGSSKRTRSPGWVPSPLRTLAI